MLLLTLLSVALFAGMTITLLVLQWRRRHLTEIASPHASTFTLPTGSWLRKPTTWLAVRSRNVHFVQQALALNNAQPCTWIEGLAEAERLFIAPPVKGWILVIGAGLPRPGEDVDACFRFLNALSRKVGEVQFFQADPILGHHAWVRVEDGHVTRAYAWALKTLWNQGQPTRAERNLDVKCFQYLESPERTLDQPDFAAANVEKIPQLAAQWSLDPASVSEDLFEHAYGIAGEPPRRY